MLQNFADTSSFFKIYKGGALLLGRSAPLFPADRWQPHRAPLDQPCHGNHGLRGGTYTFALSTGLDAKTLTVGVRDATNLASIVTNGIITLAFDTSGVVSLFVDDNFFDDL